MFHLFEIENLVMVHAREDRLSVDQICSRCQQTNSTRNVGVAHEMDLLLPVLAFSCNQIRVRVSSFGIY